MRNGLITFVVVGVVAAVLLQAFLGGPETIDETILISSTEAEEARAAASCEVLAEEDPLPERYHVDNASELNPDQVYTDTRPTHSGPHTAGLHPVTAAASSQIDEVSSTHNLEHGSIIVWWDPDQVDGSEIGDWAETLNANGFRRDVGGVGILTSPYEDPGIASGKAIALRAWGTAVDCDEWDETVAHSFVLDHYGTHGIAPERTLAPFPGDVLAYEDVDEQDLVEQDAPTDNGMDPEGEAPDDADGNDEAPDDAEDEQG